MDGGKHFLVMVNAMTGAEEEVAHIPLHQKKVYLKANCDFTKKKDMATFFYSLNGKEWVPIGPQFKMSYTIPHFMGYRFGLFYYATKTVGGFVDFDYFHISP
ncbi:hypothetical protein D3C81_1885210 [compost metagenome]